MELTYHTLSHNVCNGTIIFLAANRGLLAFTFQDRFAEIFVLTVCAHLAVIFFRPDASLCLHSWFRCYVSPSSSGRLGAGTWEHEKTVCVRLEQAGKLSKSLRKKDERARNRME